MNRRFVLRVACVAILVFSAILFIRYCNEDTEEAPPFVFTADEIAHLAKLVGAADPPATPEKKDETWIGYAADGFAGGSGAKEDPYRIAIAEQLAYLAKTVNAGNPYKDCHFEQTQDIDISEHEWVPIGVDKDVYFTAPETQGWRDSTVGFMGYFDGKNKTIHGLNIKQFWAFNGLFGLIHDGSFKNIRLTGVNIENGYCSGGIAGAAFLPSSTPEDQDSPSRITNCMVEGTVAGFRCVGGIAGILGGCDELSMDIVSADIKVTYDRRKKYKMSLAEFAPEDKPLAYRQVSPLFKMHPPNQETFSTCAGGMVGWLRDRGVEARAFDVKACTAKVAFSGDISLLGSIIGFPGTTTVGFTKIQVEMDIKKR